MENIAKSLICLTLSRPNLVKPKKLKKFFCQFLMFFYDKNGNILKIHKNVVHHPFLVLGLMSPVSHLRSGLKSPVSHLEQFFFPYKQ